MSNYADEALAPFIGKRIKNIVWCQDWCGYQFLGLEMEDGTKLKVYEASQTGDARLQIGDVDIEPRELSYKECYPDE